MVDGVCVVVGVVVGVVVVTGGVVTGVVVGVVGGVVVTVGVVVSTGVVVSDVPPQEARRLRITAVNRIIAPDFFNTLFTSTSPIILFKIKPLSLWLRGEKT